MFESTAFAERYTPIELLSLAAQAAGGAPVAANQPRTATVYPGLNGAAWGGRCNLTWGGPHDEWVDGDNPDDPPVPKRVDADDRPKLGGFPTPPGAVSVAALRFRAIPNRWVAYLGTDGSFTFFVHNVPPAASAFDLDMSLLRPTGVAGTLRVALVLPGAPARTHNGTLDIPAAGASLPVNRRVTWRAEDGPPAFTKNDDGDAGAAGPDFQPMHLTLTDHLSLDADVFVLSLRLVFRDAV